MQVPVLSWTPILLMPLSICIVQCTSWYTSCDNEDLKVTKLINSLSSKLEQQITTKENYFFSPLSISVALAMVYEGARGSTRQQMSDALSFDMFGKHCQNSKVGEEFRELIREVRSEDEGLSLILTNGLFIQTGYKISPFYLSKMKNYFDSDVAYLNFVEEKWETVNQINQWISNSTRGKIPKLLNEPLDQMIVMVLVNAIHFKGSWEIQFLDTVVSDTFFTNGTTKVVPFMTVESKFNFFEDDTLKYTFLELNYANGNISMILALPKSTRELPQLSLTNEHLCNLRENFQNIVVNVQMPKFQLDYSRELSNDMRKLGMEELFSDRADLSGIREQNDLHVSLMIHKAVIEVNEKGSEASAVSGIGFSGRQRLPKREQFIANHPFLFYLVHKNTDTIIFSGRLSDPQ